MRQGRNLERTKLVRQAMKAVGNEKPDEAVRLTNVLIDRYVEDDSLEEHLLQGFNSNARWQPRIAIIQLSGCLGYNCDHNKLIKKYVH